VLTTSKYTCIYNTLASACTVVFLVVLVCACIFLLACFCSAHTPSNHTRTPVHTRTHVRAPTSSHTQMHMCTVCIAHKYTYTLCVLHTCTHTQVRGSTGCRQTLRPRWRTTRKKNDCGQAAALGAARCGSRAARSAGRCLAFCILLRCV